MYFIVKKKIYAKSSLKEHSQFDWKCWILDTTSLTSYFIAKITLAFIFECEGQNFLRYKVHSVRQPSLTLTAIKSFKRPEVNSGPTYFSTFMNNGKAFPSSDGIAYSYQCPDQLQALP